MNNLNEEVTRGWAGAYGLNEDKIKVSTYSELQLKNDQDKLAYELYNFLKKEYKFQKHIVVDKFNDTKWHLINYDNGFGIIFTDNRPYSNNEYVGFTYSRGPSYHTHVNIPEEYPEDLIKTSFGMVIQMFGRRETLEIDEGYSKNTKKLKTFVDIIKKKNQNIKFCLDSLTNSNHHDLYRSQFNKFNCPILQLIFPQFKNFITVSKPQ